LQILEQVKTYMTQRGYRFAPALVENFYLSLKSRPFVILGCYDGTEPALLPRLFAEGLGATAENGRYRELTVRPDWMDSSDLFGYLDLEGHFRPGIIIDFLKAAQNDPEKPYFLCLDKILLDRMAYYLREVLASVESRETESPKPLVTMAYYGRDTTAAEQYGQIPALDNLYIIGTINMDETGRPLDQRLLDRVHMLEFDRDAVTAIESTETPPPVDADNEFLKTVYFRLDQCPEEERQTYFALFDPLNSILAQGKAYMGFRLRNDAILFLMHNRDTAALPAAAALDHAICMKVLTRIQGAKALVQPVLEAMLAQYGQYPKTAAKARAMLAQCEETGYTSFWG